MTWFKRVFFLLVALLSTLASASEGRGSTPVKCFSDMTMHPVERDYVGFVVVLLEHRKGVSVVFQEGAGALEAPLLVEGKIDAGRISFDLPPSALTPGTWNALLRGKKLVVTNPAGNKFTLKQGCR